MKNVLLATVLTCCLGAALPGYAANQTVTMSVEKMSCALCPLTVRKAMERVEGVQDVEVDFDTKTATVEFDDTKTTAAEVAQASTDVGYPAAPITD